MAAQEAHLKGIDGLIVQLTSKFALVLLAVIVAGFFALRPATASGVFFDDYVEFQEATTDILVHTEPLEGLPAPTFLPYTTITDIALSAGFLDVQLFAGQMLLNTTGSDPITFDFPSAINAFGIDITATGVFRPLDLVLTTSNGSQIVFDDYTFVGPPDADLLFAGVVDSTPFDSVVFSFSSTDDLLWLDNIRFGVLRTNSNSVPEPTSVQALLAVLVTGLAHLRSKRSWKAFPCCD